MAEKRKKVWIDRLQTLLSIRLAVYFISFQITIVLLLAIEQSTSAAMVYLFGPWASLFTFILIAAIMTAIAAMFIWDVVKLLHRLVGPLVRFRKAINALAAGEELTLITLRKGDHLQELKDEFNEMLRALEQRGAVVIQSPEARKAEKQTASA